MKTKTKKPKTHITPSEREMQALTPLINHVRENRGASNTVLTLLNERTGEEIIRSQLARWLDPDPAKRSSPRLGIGLALLEVAGEVLTSDMAAVQAVKSVARSNRAGRAG